MLTLITGPLGSGKTLFLTVLGKVSEKKVISNYHLKFPYQKFSMYDFADGKYDNATILIDEAYTMLESREFMSSENKALSYTLFQSRKKSLDLILTVQLNSTLDVRFRQLADIVIEALGLVKRKGVIYFKYHAFQTGKDVRVAYLKYEKAREFFELFDTNEIIQPIHRNKLLGQILSTEEKMKKVKKLSEIILKQYKGMKITKNTVKYELFKNDFPSFLISFVFEEIRQNREREEMNLLQVK